MEPGEELENWGPGHAAPTVDPDTRSLLSVLDGPAVELQADMNYAILEVESSDHGVSLRVAVTYDQETYLRWKRQVKSGEMEAARLVLIQDAQQCPALVALQMGSTWYNGLPQ